jgi:hypothetical protein
MRPRLQSWLQDARGGFEPRGFHNVDAIHSRPVPCVQVAFSFALPTHRNTAKDFVRPISAKCL